MSELQPNTEEQAPNRVAGAIGAVIGAGGALALTFVGETPELIQDNLFINIPLRAVTTFIGGVMVYDVVANSLIQDVYRTLFPKVEQ